MNLIRHPFAGAADLQAMAALANAFASENLHVVDLPYRFSSWAFDFPDNIGLWVDGSERLAGWAVMQTPFWTVDCVPHPDAEVEVYPQMLAWADERARQSVNSPGGRPIWFVNVFARQSARIHQLEQAGFASQADVGEDSWTKVLMARENTDAMEDPLLPEGFTIRPLAGDAEVEPYVELHRSVFESKNMTVTWRAQTRRQSSYVADQDLVAVAPDGQLAGFCVGWINTNAPAGVRGQVEPLGVREEYRKARLGRSLLLEGVRRLQARGATMVYVETDNYRDEAFMLYHAAGFRVIEDVLVFRKDYAPLEAQS